MKTNNLLNKNKFIALAALAAQLNLNLFACGGYDDGYVAHEWGTFTSVQGADGVPQAWHPLITSDLPAFVYDRTGGSGSGQQASHYYSLGKESFIALQRMETPVIYFYSDHERTVSASVLFPKGQMTEWYPVASGPAAAPLMGDIGFLRYGKLAWENVRVLPATAPAKSPPLPDDRRGSHYYAARETDANLVQVKNAKDGKLETEKFLFYRGVGWFATPLKLSMASDESYLELRNQGAETLKHLFVVEMKQGKGRFLYHADLAPKQSERFTFAKPLGEGAQVTAKLAAEMRAALIADGLYPREAAAMVATWNESWFGEDGLRVLYLLPRGWTDEALPLELQPAPKTLVRTMVGRAEMIKPSVESELAGQIARYGAANGEARRRVIAETRALGLGRFLEPAVRRAQNQSKSEEFRELARQLLEETGKPVKAEAAEKIGKTAETVALYR